MTFGRSKGFVDYENLKRFIYSNAGIPRPISHQRKEELSTGVLSVETDDFFFC
jgi:hypothetical protein